MWAHLKTHCLIALSYPCSVAFHPQSLRVFLPHRYILGLKCYVQQQSTMPGWPVLWTEGAMGLSGFFFPNCSYLHCSWLCSKHPGRDTYPVHGQAGRSTALPPLCTSWATQEPLATSPPPQPGSTGPEGMHCSSAHQDGGDARPIWKYFLFTNVLFWK